GDAGDCRSRHPGHRRGAGGDLSGRGAPVAGRALRGGQPPGGVGPPLVVPDAARGCDRGIRGLADLAALPVRPRPRAAGRRAAGAAAASGDEECGRVAAAGGRGDRGRRSEFPIVGRVTMTRAVSAERMEDFDLMTLLWVIVGVALLLVLGLVGLVMRLMQAGL